MIPSDFAGVPHIPKTAGGKLDRPALIELYTHGQQTRLEHMAPRTKLEEFLVDLWQEVLPATQIGVGDDFFQLGGHSLLSLRVLARIRRSLNVVLSPAQFFQSPTIKALAEFIEQEQGEGRFRLPPIGPYAHTDKAPLSLSQERFLFFDRMAANLPVYNIPLALRMKGHISPKTLAAAWTCLVARYEILRTNFAVHGETPCQNIRDPFPVPIKAVDLSHLGEKQEAQLRQTLIEEYRTPFQLEQGPLFRLSLIRLGEEGWVFLLMIHHIIADGWSLNLMLTEMWNTYSAIEAGSFCAADPPKLQYTDYALWQRDWLANSSLRKPQLDYWKEALAGAPFVLDLPFDKPRPQIQTFNGGVVSFDLESELSQGMVTLAMNEGVTPFTVLFSVFNTLLFRYSGQADILVGTPAAGRDLVEFESMLGCFVNTLVLRTRLDQNLTFSDLLKQVHQVASAAFGHQALPFDFLVKQLSPVRDLSRNPLFQAMMIFQNSIRLHSGTVPLEIAKEPLQREYAQVDLSLWVSQHDQRFHVDVSYNSDLFEQATIARFAQSFQHLLQSGVANSNQTLGDIPVLSQNEQALLADWGDGGHLHGDVADLMERFEVQARLNPNAIALTFREVSLTYDELQQRSNQLARYLQGKGAGLETFIGLSLERSIEMVVALLAILKVNGAYIPLDPNYPKDRLRFIIQDSGMKLLVTTTEIASGLGPMKLTVVCLRAGSGLYEHESREDLASKAGLESLAYMIYTSGSTGEPKGVQISRRALNNFLEAMSQKPGFQKEDVLASVTSMSFDIFGLEVYLPLLMGGRLVVVPPDVAESGQALAKLLEAEHVTVMQATPITWKLLLEAGWSGKQLGALCGGEAMPLPLGQSLSENVKALWNMYGPTETTIWSCVADIAVKPQSIAIGRPILNTQIYVLNGLLQPLPIGAPGELFIGGAGLARGYWNRPALTADKFRPNPFANQPGERLYATGDLVRYSSHGSLQFLGRKDFQIKIRGLRIELGEIESVLMSHIHLKEVAVIVDRSESDNPHLVAFFTLNGEVSPSVLELRGFLRKSLPDYMIPTNFVSLPSFPLTVNGKLDRKALAEVDTSRSRASSKFMAPRNELEEFLANLCQEILSAKRVGVNDNFFELGGHSLLLLQVLARIRGSLNVVLTPAQFFQKPTVEGLAQTIEGERGTEHFVMPPIRPSSYSQIVPLSLFQERFWFFDRMVEDPVYNIPFALRVEGRLNHKLLAAAWTELVARYEILRTNFTVDDGAPCQHIKAPFSVPIETLDLTSFLGQQRQEQLDQALKEADSTLFELEDGPLFRVSLIKMGAEEWVLVLIIHHIIADGWSLNILLAEMWEIYTALQASQPWKRTSPRFQYADYALWQREWLANSSLLNPLLDYWKKALEGAPCVLDLPLTKARPQLQTYRGGVFFFSLSPDVSEAILAFARREGVTPFAFLFAAFNILLFRYSGQKDILVGTPVSGRDLLEFESMPGCFVNTLVLRTRLGDGLTFLDILRQVHKTASTAFSHQSLPFDFLVKQLNPERDVSRNPLFQVLLAYQNAIQIDSDAAPFAISRETIKHDYAHVDLSVSILERAEQFKISFNFNTDLFDLQTIARMAGHFSKLLESAIVHPSQTVSRLDLLTKLERERLLDQERAPQKRTASKSLPALFEEQAASKPDAVALVFKKESFTYADLNRDANRLAAYLRALGVGPDTLVGISLERSPKMVVALLAVLKAGGAYVPLDPNYPKDRLFFMVRDSGIARILTQEKLLPNLKELRLQTICLDRDWKNICLLNGHNIAMSLEASDLAYLIYTSGSTGQPKGVSVTHQGLSSLVYWARQKWGAPVFKCCLGSYSMNFDPCAWDLWVTLSLGGKILLVDNVLDLGSHPQKEYLTFLSTVPAMMEQLLREHPLPNALKVVHLGGEALSLALAKKLFQRSKVENLYNVYGPTEDTVISTYCSVTPHTERKPPIGKPIPGTTAHVLDRNLEPLPFGVPGELFLAGSGLARGYFGRAALTAEKFLPNPFSTIAGARMYRTGDVARYLNDGNLDYLGRVDQQVKVHGLRIELGEIEALLAKQASVLEVLIDVKRDGNQQPVLVAYVVPKPGKTLSLDEMKVFLSEFLPSYMVPRFLVFVEKIPLGPNGKPDRDQLPLPIFEAAEVDEVDRTLAKNWSDLERRIAEIWCAALGKSTVGLHTNFFDAGGNSLLLLQVRSKVGALLGHAIPLTDFFRFPTIHSLAEHLQANDLGLAEVIEEAPLIVDASPCETDVAVIGLACRFPDAPDLEAFWARLRDGHHSIRFFSNEELAECGVSPKLFLAPTYVKAHGYLEGIDLFDREFFDFSAIEAKITDPQQRLCLETSWQALECAGYDPYRFKGPIGVFMGMGVNRYYQQYLIQNPKLLNSLGAYQIMLSNDKDFLATRISYKLNLKGPSQTIQTACSTSLVAIHSACNSLLQHECDMALAGGVSLQALSKQGYLYERGGIASPDGHCRAFDADAKGTVGGSGCGVVLLKPLKAALRDGDSIWAVVKGGALNNDGSDKIGYTAPSVEGQLQVICQAFQSSQVHPGTIGFVEAHGTGTQLGDPIEVKALADAFRQKSRGKCFCALGSVKTNIGHLDAASGAAGFIKTTLALKHGQIPPTLFYKKSNPQIDFENSPFFVNNELMDWHPLSGVRRAGVSSFGMGGTNAHMVLQEAPRCASSPRSRPCQLFLLSAKTEKALDEYLQNLKNYLEQKPECHLADIAYTLQVGRSRFPFRAMWTACDVAQSIAILEKVTSIRRYRQSQRPPLAFMFSGQGSQYLNMGRQLYQTERLFKQIVDDCAFKLKPIVEIDVRYLVFSSKEADRELLDQTQYLQPILFVFEYALARLLMSWGIQPQALIGHSLGEYSAACLGGVFQLEAALWLIGLRGKLMQALPRGSMLVVALSEADLRPILPASLSVSAVNAPWSCVVGGEDAQVRAFAEELATRDIYTKLFNIPSIMGVWNA